MNSSQPADEVDAAGRAIDPIVDLLDLADFLRENAIALPLGPGGRNRSAQEGAQAAAEQDDSDLLHD